MAGGRCRIVEVDGRRRIDTEMTSYDWPTAEARPASRFRTELLEYHCVLVRTDFIRADRQALGLFYRRHGYLFARVDSVSVLPVGTSTKSDVHFFVIEGPRTVIDTIRVMNPGPVPEKEIRESLLYHEGSPLDFPTLEASRDSVVNEYADRGYVLARVVDSLSVDSTRAHVLYDVRPGPRVFLGKVVVEGTQQTKPHYVSRELVLHDGDVMRRSKLVHSQQRIFDSGLYTDAVSYTHLTLPTNREV